MKKYLHLTCSVCKRSIDRIVDTTHFTPDSCTITSKCQGRLFPVQYRSNGEVIPLPQVGVTDWQPRNATVTTSAASTERALVDTSTGSTRQLVLAAFTSSFTAAPPASGSTLKLTLKQKNDTPKSYKQYVYRLETSFGTISGVESGLEKKTLRYSTTDLVEVYLNGVKLSQGTGSSDFSLYDGTTSSTVPPNTIGFNEIIALPGVTQVDVIVSASVPETQIELTFVLNEYNEARAGTGAWENVDYVKMFTGTVFRPFYLFTLDLADATALKLNTILTVATTAVLNDFTSIPTTDVHFLLARKPYTNLDRYTNISVPASNLASDSYLKFFVDAGEQVLYVQDSAVSTLYPVLEVHKLSTELTIKTATSGVTDQIVVDGSVIVGPDA